MKAPIIHTPKNFEQFFAYELLKSEFRRSNLGLLLISIGLVLGLVVMLMGENHFASMGDQNGQRYWLLAILGCAMLYHAFCYHILSKRIRTNQQSLRWLTLGMAIFEITLITLWLLIECLIFNPGAMFESPLTQAYPIVIFLSCLQLSWRLSLLSGVVAAGQYLLLVAWYWISWGEEIPVTVSSYLPLHGMRAFIYFLCGIAAAFLAYEIRKGIGNTLQHLEERDYVVRIFGRYLSDEVVDDILRSPEGLRLGGRRRIITVMMTDLRGFTTLSESLPPEAVIAMLNNCLATLTEVIIKYRGTIDEFIGDAILALFGAPFASENDAERAVACAIEMQLAMVKINAWNKSQGYPALEMGIGIHTGPAVVGNIGSEKRSKYGVVGSTINLTSRIESYTVGGQILISADTVAAVGPHLRVSQGQKIQPKGFQQALEIFEVQAITGEYNLELPQSVLSLTPLHSPLPVQFVILQGKDLSGTAHSGEITALSPQEICLVSQTPLEILSNLSLELTLENRVLKLLGKVVAVSPTENMIRLSNLPLPEPLNQLYHSVPSEITPFLAAD